MARIFISCWITSRCIWHFAPQSRLRFVLGLGLAYSDWNYIELAREHFCYMLWLVGLVLEPSRRRRPRQIFPVGPLLLSLFSLFWVCQFSATNFRWCAHRDDFPQTVNWINKTMPNAWKYLQIHFNSLSHCYVSTLTEPSIKSGC